MRPAEIEAWTLRVIDAVVAGQHIEDTRVELKADWPDPTKSARRLAGHLNASRGDDVLWLIGLDERTGITGAAASDTATWWAKIAREFVETTPEPVDVTVHAGGYTVVALHFTSDRVPFVIRNPAHGTAGNVVELEVPWREATAVRSARRADLLRLLVPQVRAPKIEVLNARVSATADGHNKRDGLPGVTWEARALLYCEADIGPPVVIPWHRVTMTLSSGPLVRSLNPTLEGHTVTRERTERSPLLGGPRVTRATIHTGADQLLIEGSGRVTCTGSLYEGLVPEMQDHDAEQDATLQVVWTAVDAEMPQRMVIHLTPITPKQTPEKSPPLWRRIWGFNEQ